MLGRIIKSLEASFESVFEYPITASVDVGLNRIFYDHLFENPAVPYTTTEKLQQLKLWGCGTRNP